MTNFRLSLSYELKTWEFLDYTARLAGLKKIGARKKAVEEMLENVLGISWSNAAAAVYVRCHLLTHVRSLDSQEYLKGVLGIAGSNISIPVDIPKDRTGSVSKI